MRLVCLEIKKILSSYAILGFVALCFAFNTLIILSNESNGYTDSEATEPPNVFIGYDTSEIARRYVNALNLDGRLAEDMYAKYEKLQTEVDRKAERGDSFSPYTYGQHKKLFGSVMTVLCREGVLLAVLTMLFVLGYENVNRTDGVVYSTNAGRRIAKHKFIAAFIAGIGAYLLLMILTLSLHFAFNDYNGLWGSNISGGFNGIPDIVTGFRPFTTWHSFTVLSYLIATIAVSLGVMLCFGVIGFVAGTSIRNHYFAFLTVILASVFFVAIPTILPSNTYAMFVFALSPVWILLKQSFWFTDGGIDVLWPHFETLGVCACLAILLSSAVFAAHKFRKKDIL